MFRPLLKQDIKSLRVFMLVADCQGVIAAQSKLNMSQSSISTHLSRLESRLGFTLCYRGRSGFRLTDQGKEVYRASQELFEAAEFFNRQILSIKGDMVGELHIAIIDYLPRNFSIAFSKVIKNLYFKHPELLINLDIRSPQEIEAAVATGELDMGIGYFGRPMKNLSYEHILVEEQAVFCHKSHPFFKKTPTIEELEQYTNWVSCSHIISNDLLPVKPRYTNAVAYHMEAVAHFIFAGTHLGYLPTDYAQRWVEKGELKMLLPEQTKYFMTHHLVSSHQSSKLKTTFIQMLKEEYAQCWNSVKEP